MKHQEDLIYELIFSNMEDYEIIVSDYIDDIYKYDRFIKKMKSVLKKSNVSILKESVEVTINQVKWNLKVKK